MKRMKYYALAAVLLFCGIGLTTSCGVEDTPVEPSTGEKEAIENRNELIWHMENDAKTMADVFKIESFKVTSQAYEQLLALMKSDKDFLTNIRALLSAVSEEKALLGISPVEAGSELAKMGYLLYITMDNSGFGVRVVFDGKGGCRFLSAKNMEFIFPASIDGIGTTLFKLIIKDSDDYYLSVTDAHIQNLKHIACVNRFPRSLTMTLTGFIDNKELTLSETVIGLELPQKENSAYVSFDAKSFGLTGKQHNYPNTGNESALDFSLNMDKDNMTLGYDYACDGASIVECEARMQHTQQFGFLSQMSKNAFNIADLKAVSIRILGDLTLSGTITDGASFAEDFPTAIKNRQQVSSPDVLAEIVESLNESCHLQLSCKQMTKPEDVGFCVVQKDQKYMIEPALKDLKTNEYIPICQIVDVQTMENFDKLFNLSFTPGGNATGSALQIYSTFLQMIPLTY